MTVRFIAREYRLQKLGNSAEEYEDASAVNHTSRAATKFGRYAIADGATTTSFSAEWADMLVKDAIAGGPLSSRSMAARLRPLQQELSQTISARQLPWYAQEKARRGAFATLLTLHLSRKRTGMTRCGGWKASAIGDSCLFVVRDQKLIQSFPVTSSLDFDDHPILIASRPVANPLTNTIKTVSGEWQVGDQFFLITDALAQWFLRSFEQGGLPWQELTNQSRSTPGDWFPDFIARLCEVGEMRNDDATLMIVEVVDGD